MSLSVGVATLEHRAGRHIVLRLEGWWTGNILGRRFKTHFLLEALTDGSFKGTYAYDYSLCENLTNQAKVGTLDGNQFLATRPITNIQTTRSPSLGTLCSCSPIQVGFGALRQAEFSLIYKLDRSESRILPSAGGASLCGL